MKSVSLSQSSMRVSTLAIQFVDPTDDVSA
jgi:hypothetical protein